MDHLGLYEAHNDYGRLARDMAQDLQGKIDFIGFRSVIDKRFATALSEDAPLSPISQAMHPRLREVVDFLSASSMPERSRIASFLLDMAGEDRDTFFNFVDSDLDQQKTTKRPRSFSSHGDVRLTLYARLEGVTPRDDATMADHARALIMMQGEADRNLVELVYDGARKLKAVNWRGLDLDGLSASETDRLKGLADAIRQRRLAKATGKNKPGRNEQCPCGSGKKSKKCCFA